MTHPSSLKRSTILSLLFSLPLAGCCAQGPPHEQMNEQMHGRHHGPPPEAIEACKDKQEGDIVTFTGRQGESIKATCRSMEGMLAAVPEGMWEGRRPPGDDPGK